MTTTHTESEEHGMRHRWVFGLGLVGILSIGLVAVRSSPEEEGTAGVAAAPGRVHAILASLQGRWAERNIERLVPDWLTAEDCRREIELIVRYPKHPWFRAAVLLAIRMDLTDLVPTFAAVMPDVEDEDTRALLVVVVDRHQPWTDKKVAELLAAETATVVIAMLQAAGNRSEPPLELIADQLVASDARIRRAALAALPATIPAAIGERITAAAERSTDTEPILAVGRCADSPVVDAFLYERLGNGPDECNAVLEALGQRGTRLVHADRVLEIAADGSRSVSTRARALHCLERTGTAKGIERLEKVNLRHPVLDYFAARSLLQSQRPAGLQLLLDVVLTDDGATNEADAAMVAEARMGARQLLAHLSGTHAGADPATWETWINRGPAIASVALPPSVVQIAP